MARPLTLRSVLSHLKKHSLQEKTADDQSDEVLSALLLQLACAQAWHSEQDTNTFARLYDFTNHLLPHPLKKALPFPSAEAFKRSAKLLSAPPDAVRALDPCILGYAYQFFCASKRERAKTQVQSANKTTGKDETIAFTQLYTPTDVVDYLIREALSEDVPSEVRLIDPSCGTGNFLWRTFDLLLHDGGIASPGAVRQASLHLLRKTLHGCDLDIRALWIGALGFAERLDAIGVELQPADEFEGALNLSDLRRESADPTCETFGALSRDWPKSHMLSQKYSAVVGNPPYIGRKLLDRNLKSHLAADYPHAKQDLCTAFLERGLELLRPQGRLSYITQASLLYLPTYRQLRERLLDEYYIYKVVEAGSQIFPLQSGEKVNSILIIVENAAAERRPSTFHDGFREDSTAYSLDQATLKAHRGAAFNYKCPPAIISIRQSSAKLSAIADIRQGLATSDNQRFIKWWWQVPFDEIGKRWMPYAKGAGSERWFAPIETVIDWHNDGADIKQAVAENYPYLHGNVAWVVKNERYYFRKGLTFSLVNTKSLCVRDLPAGCIFDVAGSAVFADPQDESWLLAYLNSSFIAAYAAILNPTINYQVGDLKELPVVAFDSSTKQRLAELAVECVERKRSLFRFNDSNIQSRTINIEEEWRAGFARVQAGLNRDVERITGCELEIDEIVQRHVALVSPESVQQLKPICDQAIARRKAPTMPFQTAEEFARQLVRLALYEDDDARTVERRLPGCLPDLQTYIRHDFIPEQKRLLHGTTRANNLREPSRNRS